MISLIRKFAASPFSGYALIALVVAAAGAGYWFWTELKEFGGLEQKAEAQEEIIAVQYAKLEQLQADADKRTAALQNQVNRTAMLERNARIQQLAVQEAMRNADKATRDCMSMQLADSLLFGPTVGDEGS